MLVLLFSCVPEPSEEVDPLPAEELPAAASPVEPPSQTSLTALLALPMPASMRGMRGQIEQLLVHCEVDCAPLIASARSDGLSIERREIVWWALSAATVSEPVRAEIEAGIDMPSASPKLWPAMAENLRHTASGRATLTALMTEGEHAALRAAAACGMLSEVPMESWKDHPLDAEAINAMGICATPWQHGQVDSPGAPG